MSSSVALASAAAVVAVDVGKTSAAVLVPHQLPVASMTVASALVLLNPAPSLPVIEFDVIFVPEKSSP